MAIADHSSVIAQITPILQAPDHIAVLALDPHSYDPDTRDDPARFHGFLVLGQTATVDSAEAAAVGALALESVVPWGDWRCVFVPRHGLRVQSGEQAIDLVICFECGEVSVHPRPPYQGRIGYRRDTRQQLDGILARAGIAVAP